MIDALRSLWRSMAAPLRRRFMVICLIGTVASLLDLVSLGMVPAVVTVVFSSESEQAAWMPEALWNVVSGVEQGTLLTVMLLALSGVIIVKGLISILNGYLLGDFSRRMRTDFTRRSFAYYMTRDYEWLKSTNSAEIVRDLIVEVNIAIAQLARPLISTVPTMVVAFGTVGLLLYMAPGASTVALVLLAGATAVALRYSNRRIGRSSELAQKARKHKLLRLNESFAGVREVTVSGALDDFVADVELRTNREGELDRVRGTLRAFLQALVESSVVLIMVAVIALLYTLGYSGPEMLAITALYAAALLRLRGVVNAFAGTITTLTTGVVSWNAISHAFSAEAAETRPSGRQSRPTPFEQLECRGVSFTYKGADAPAISTMELTIAAGDTIGVVGSTGSGKSTFLDLVLGLLTPTSGQVLVNGKPLSENLEDWWKQVGLVPQEVLIYDASLAFNVALDENVDPEKLQRAIRAAHLEQLIDELPQGVDTVLQERGSRLSGGQRQRVAIARALYREPQVLILDEATSALDHETENAVIDAIDELGGDMTIIAVAHRVTSLRSCRRILSFERGHAHALGSYQEFVNSDGRPGASEPLVAGAGSVDPMR